MRIAINGMLLSRCESGVELSIRRLVRALAECGTEQYELFAPRRFPAAAIPSGRVRTIATGVPAHWRAVRIFWEQLRLPSAATRAACDLIHAPAYIAPLGARVPVVLTVYDLMALDAPGLCRRINALNYRLLMPASLRKAAGLIAPSRFTAEAVRRRFPWAEARTRVIPLGVTPAFFDAVPPSRAEAIRARYGLPDRFLLFVGRQEPKKNLARLVQACHLLKAHGRFALKLVIAGAPGWRAAPLLARVRELGMQEEVVFAGFIPEEDLPGLYHLAEAMVFPSLYEGFGLPPLEAMACGLPVVCSDTTSLPEVVGVAAVRVDPLSPAAIAAGIRTVTASPGTRRHLSDRGRERALQFTWERTAQQTDAFFRAVCSAGGKEATPP